MHLSTANRSALMSLARATLREQFTAANLPLPPPLDHPQLTQAGGCFVSLHERVTHRLRGCVGRVNAQQALWEAVRRTAVEVLADPRFSMQRVTADELDRLEIEISILLQPRLAQSVEEFDPPNHGVYLIHAGRAGFFLPQVARETGWGREQLLARLCTEKMGLAAEAWKLSEMKMWLFKVEIVGPEPV